MVNPFVRYLTSPVHYSRHLNSLWSAPLFGVGSEMFILYPVSGFNAENILSMLLHCKESCFDRENNIGRDIWEILNAFVPFHKEN